MPTTGQVAWQLRIINPPLLPCSPRLEEEDACAGHRPYREQQQATGKTNSYSKPHLEEEDVGCLHAGVEDLRRRQLVVLAAPHDLHGSRGTKMDE